MTDLSLATDVAVLKKDVERMSEFFGRLDTAIEKISELSSNINSLLAVHSQRLDKQDETNRDIYTSIEKSQTDLDSEIKFTNSLVSDLKNQVSSFILTFDTKVSDIVSNHTKEITVRVRTLEKWRWYITGSVAVITSLAMIFSKQIATFLTTK